MKQKNLEKSKFIQHGDVGLHPINKLPEGLIEIKHNGEFIVALGEATGHAHRVKGDFKLYQDKDGRYYFATQGKTSVDHYNTITRSPAEHKELPMVAPFYYADFEDDYNPITEELSKTRD